MYVGTAAGGAGTYTGTAIMAYAAGGGAAYGAGTYDGGGDGTYTSDGARAYTVTGVCGAATL